MIEGKAALLVMQATSRREQRAADETPGARDGFDRLLDEPARNGRRNIRGSGADAASTGSQASSVHDLLDDGFELPTGISAELNQAYVLAQGMEPPPGFYTARIGDGGPGIHWQELAFLLMGLYANGRLDQRIRFGSSLTKEDFGTERVQSQPSAPGKPQGARPGNYHPGIVAVHTAQAAVAIFSQFTRGADAWLARAAASQANYERVAARVLPPRENLLVCSADGDKRVYVRNFFSPADAAERIRDLNELTGGRFAGATLYINGTRAGRM